MLVRHHRQSRPYTQYIHGSAKAQVCEARYVYVLDVHSDGLPVEAALMVKFVLAMLYSP